MCVYTNRFHLESTRPSGTKTSKLLFYFILFILIENKRKVSLFFFNEVFFCLFLFFILFFIIFVAFHWPCLVYVIFTVNQRV